MFFRVLLFPVLFFLSLVAAKGVPLSDSPPWAPSPRCKDLMFTVQVNLDILDLPDPSNITDSPSVLSYFDKVQDVFDANKMRPLSAEYNISGRYCPGSTSSKSYDDYIMVLIHGETYTKDFWTGYFPGMEKTSNYSFQNTTNLYGIASLAIDRPGNGLSTHPVDARELQSPVHREVILQTLAKLRKKEIIDKGFRNIVLGGHGLGAEIAFQMIRDYPDQAIAILLCGWSQDGSAFPRIDYKMNLRPASSVNSTRFGNLTSGYLAMGDPGAREYVYYSGLYPYIMPYLDFANQGTLAVGERVRYYSSMGSVAANFKGNVMIITGANDKLYCGEESFGVCGNDTLRSLKAKFPKAKTFDTALSPNTGHVWPFHYSGTFLFSVYAFWWAWTVY